MPQTFNTARITAALLPVPWMELPADAPLPDTLLLGCLRDPRLRIRKAIPVRLGNEAGQVIAEAAGLNEYGAGANQSAAVTELQHAIAELYHSLEADKDRLGPGLARTWTILQEHIRPRSKAGQLCPNK